MIEGITLGDLLKIMRLQDDLSDLVCLELREDSEDQKVICSFEGDLSLALASVFPYVRITGLRTIIDGLYDMGDPTVKMIAWVDMGSLPSFQYGGKQ